MSDPVARRVRAAIEDHGPIGFDEYMEIALYGPGGFFETPPVGADEHFVTSPHVHPFVFAHCVRDALLDAWFALGEPEPLPVVELGAGDGTFAEALSSAFAELPAPRPAYTGVEISTGARAALGARGFATASALGELEPFDGVVVANEVLDNLPFVPVRGRPDGPKEVRVGARGASLVEIEVPWSDASGPPPRLEPGEETTVPVGAFALLRDARAGAPTRLRPADRLRQRGGSGGAGARVPRAPGGRRRPRGSGWYRHHRGRRRLDDRGPRAFGRVGRRSSP